jgi:hypothetical protein
MTLKAILCLALGASTASAADTIICMADETNTRVLPRRAAVLTRPPPAGHIHNHMSARIKQLDADGNVLQEEARPRVRDNLRGVAAMAYH